MNRLPRWLPIGLVMAPTLGLVVFYLWPFVNLVVAAVDAESIRTTLGRERTRSIIWFMALPSISFSPLIIPN